MKLFILTFESTHMVLKAEKVLLKNNHKHDIIPTPRDLSSNCGMSVRTKTDCIDDIKSLINDNNIKVQIFERSSNEI